MKQVRRVGFATVLLCITVLLITAFIVLFSTYGPPSNDKAKEISIIKEAF